MQFPVFILKRPSDSVPVGGCRDEVPQRHRVAYITLVFRGDQHPCRLVGMLDDEPFQQVVVADLVFEAVPWALDDSFGIAVLKRLAVHLEAAVAEGEVHQVGEHLVLCKEQFGRLIRSIHYFTFLIYPAFEIKQNFFAGVTIAW